MTFLLIILPILSVSPMMPLSVTSSDDALAMFYNPAGLSSNRGFNLYYCYKLEDWKIRENSALAGQLGPLGFSYLGGTSFNYGLGLGFKLGDNFGLGVRYFHQLNNYWCLGTLIRLGNFLSFGITWPDINYKDWHTIIAGIGIRPLGNRLTVFTETQLDSMIDKMWLGLELVPISGVELKGMIKTDWSFSLGIDISFGRIGIGYANAKVKNLTNNLNHLVYLRYSKDIRHSVLPRPARFLTMELSGLIQDVKPGFSLFGPVVKKTTYEILDLLNKAKEDKTIKGIIIAIEDLQLSFAQASELRDALEQIKAQGKKIIVYAPNLSTNTYFLAAVADLIISHPSGYVSIPGMYRQARFIKGTLDKLGIEVEYERVGKYKSAPELLTEDSLSSAYREVLNSILDDNYSYFLEATAKARSFKKEDFEKKVDCGFFLTPIAQKEGLIDTFAYYDQLDSVLVTKLGKMRKITERSYRKETFHNPNWVLPKTKIAVVYGSGSIVQGESRTDPISGEMTIGSKTIIRAIKKARQDKRVKAIVLRVDSPGGDGFASDLIWHEIEITKKQKPVIVSMGPVAASGGYYISCNSDKIFALPATITGSIGVFSLKMVFAGLYDKIGIKTEVIKRGEHADAFSPHRKLTPEEHQILKEVTEDFYRQFVNKVAQGRNQTFEHIDSIGQGRVWTGNQARSLGLVDSLGGLLTAIDYAKEKIKAKEVKIEFLPKLQRGFFGPFFDYFWDKLINRK
uniref:Signal peptide peptidase SppA n=1 Tax=candidate division WOR-3 bacterium TaxID=2052148 RepID=A0A7C6A7N9_UNCW3